MMPTTATAAGRRLPSVAECDDVELGIPVEGAFGSLLPEAREIHDNPPKPTRMLYSSCFLGLVLALQCG